MNAVLCDSQMFELPDIKKKSVAAAAASVVCFCSVMILSCLNAV
jgi:hypothetical protein